MYMDLEKRNSQIITDYMKKKVAPALAKKGYKYREIIVEKKLEWRFFKCVNNHFMEICFRTVFYDSIIMEFLFPSSAFSQMTFIDMKYFWKYDVTIERACEGYFFKNEEELENILAMFLEIVDEYEDKIINKCFTRIDPKFINGDVKQVDGVIINCLDEEIKPTPIE